MRRLFGLLFTFSCLCLFFLAKSNTAFAAAQCDNNKFLLIGDSISDGLAKAMGIQADWTNPDAMTANKYDSAFPYATTAWFTGAQFPTTDQLPGITQDYYASYRSKGITANAVMNTILGSTDAKVAVIMLGTNDCTKLDINTFKSNLTSIVDSVKSKNIIPILSTIPPRMSNQPQCAGGTDTWNSAIRDVASSEGIQLRDAFGAMQDASIFAGGDGLHPTRYDELVSATTSILSQVCGTSSSTTNSATNSSTNIGTHLLSFDSGGELKVIQALAGKTLPSHYPIVVNVDANNPTSFAGLAKAASDAKFAPIVRIVGISPSTDPSAMSSLASFIAGNFPPGTPIELGNEIENPKEWSGTMDQYAKLFDALATTLPQSYPLGIATLNTSNANIDVAPLFSQIITALAPSSRTRINAVFANVYVLAGCNPTYNSDRCNLKTGQWVLKQMNTLLGNRFTSNDLYITELGSVTCASYDCLQLFYEDNNSLAAKLKVGYGSAPGGSTFIHTVPAICEYWDQSSLNPHKPSKCTISQPKGVYIYPGIDDLTDAPSQLDMASKYTMTCAPRLQFSGEIKNQDLVPNGAHISISGVSGTAYINHSGSTIPLFRFDGATIPNTTTPSRRLNDLEGFFGAVYVPPKVDPTIQATDNTLTYLAQGAQSKALAPETLCQNTVQFLQSIKALCDSEPKKYNTVNPQDKSAKPFIPLPAPRAANDQCPLDFVIHTPSGDKSYLDILKEKPANACTNLGEDNQFNKDIGLIETTTPKAFKPAYIVHYTNYPSDNSNILSTLQGWLAPTPANDGKTRVQITKIFVPANVSVSSNDASFPGNSSGSVPGFTSGMINTIRSSISAEAQQNILKRQTGEEKDVLQKISTSNLLVPDGSDPLNSRYINCFECGNNQFVNTIVKRINAQIQAGGDNGDCSAGDLVGEKANERKASINPAGNPDPVHEISVVANATLTTNLANGPALMTRTFLLLPEEYRNITDYEDVLAHVLLPPEYAASVYTAGTNPKNIESAQYGKSYKFLQLNDTKPFANNGLTIHESAPETKGPIVAYSKDTPPKPLSIIGSIISTDINSFDINPTIPGGRLARGLWEIICHVAQPPQPGKTYAKYDGLEKLLQRGSDACFTNATPPTQAPTCTPPTGTMACNNWRPGQQGNSNFSAWQQTWTPSSSVTETTCSNTGSPGGSGQDAQITAGVVSLAVKVSGLTCTPPEMLIGIMAKESKGLAEDGKPYSGDPNEIGTRNCVSDAYGCGAYAYQTLDIDAKFQYAGNEMGACLQALGLDPNDHDRRKLGVSMCAAGIHMWNGSQCSSYNQPRPCNGSAPSYDSLPPQEVYNAIMSFHANACGAENIAASPYTNALPNYLGFIDQYKWFVGDVTKSTANCNSGTTSNAQQPSTSSSTAQTTADCIKIFTDSATNQKYASQLRSDLPSQQGKTNAFAGWSAWFPPKSYPPMMGTQRLFDTTCGGQKCYDYIIDKSVQAGINPYVTIGISLSEDGGLYSDKSDGSNIKHFGCDPYGVLPRYSSSPTIENKLQCLIDTFTKDKQKGLDDNSALQGYGFGGAADPRLGGIIDQISNHTYQNSCGFSL